MKFGSFKTSLLRLAAFSVAERPPRLHQAISILVSNFSSYNPVSSSVSSQFSSRRPQYDEESRGVKVSVWWDFDNCSLPTGANVFKVAQTITDAVRINGIKGPITITAFGDVFHLSRTNQEALSATGITLTHVPQGGKNSVDRCLITELLCWVTRNPPPAHLFLISSDRDFASVLHKLRMSNYNILLAGYEETTPGVLCSAASIMWDWNALVRGNNSIGKHFNQPPDGPYNSWYGHYKTPLLDPFATTKQPSNIVSSTVCRPIPEEVVKQISLVLSLYPKGVIITELRDQLSKRNVRLDKDFYGHKRFSRFLLSMPEILQVVPKGEGMFLVQACTKASSPKLSSENPKVVSVETMPQKVKQNVEEVIKESQSQESSQECVLVISQMGTQAKDEPVKENQLASSSKEKDGIFNKLSRLWYGSLEMGLDHLQEKKHICGIGDEGKGLVSEREVVDKDLESAEEVKADTEVNEESRSPGLLSRVLKRFNFFGTRNTELCNAAATGTQVDNMFAKDSFWKDVESFINSPRGFVVVSHSRSREALAKNLKEEGPSSLEPLDESKLLELVSQLISDKKWIKENPSDALPFRVTLFTEKSSSLSNPSVLRSIFVNMSKSQSDETDNGVIKKPLERSRSEVIEDCHKLIKKITEEHPGGYNMSNFKKDFLETFGYRLDYQSLGYPKLQTLIQIMAEARIESGYIVPSSTPAPYESDSLLQELGSVSKQSHDYELADDENSDAETDEEAPLKQSGDERKKKKKQDITENDILQILGSWDSVEDIGKDKLVDGILTSLRTKKPSGESRV